MTDEELEARLRAHYRAVTATLPDDPPLPRTADAALPAVGRRRPMWVLVAAVFVLVVAGGVLGWAVGRDGQERVRTDPAAPVVTTTTTAPPSTTVVAPTSLPVATGGEDGLVGVVTRVLGGLPAGAEVTSASREQGEAGRYDEVRVRSAGEVLVVAVSDDFPDAPRNITLFTTPIANDGDVGVWLAADTAQVRAVHVVLDRRVVYVRSQGESGARSLQAIQAIGRGVLDVWIRPPPGPIERSDAIDLSGDASLQLRAEVVSREGVWFVELSAVAGPPPGAELWAVYVDGRLSGRSSASPTGTFGFRLRDGLDPAHVEIVVYAQSWAGTTLASSPVVVASAAPGGR